MRINTSESRRRRARVAYHDGQADEADITTALDGEQDVGHDEQRGNLRWLSHGCEDGVETKEGGRDGARESRRLIQCTTCGDVD